MIRGNISLSPAKPSGDAERRAEVRGDLRSLVLAVSGEANGLKINRKGRSLS